MYNKLPSPYLRQSRSRHERIVSPELRKASILWRKEKKESRGLEAEVSKITRELRYYEQLNRRLSQGISNKKNELKQAQSIRARYVHDQHQVVNQRHRKKSWSCFD